MSDMHPLSGAYAVDALDDLERARFEHHLDDCPDCAAEVQSLREAAGLLALSADPTLSAELRDRVLADIRTVRPLPPTHSQVEVVRHRARRWFPRTGPALVAAAVAAFVVVAGGAGLAATHPFGNQAPVAVSVSQQVMQAADARTQSTELGNGGQATLYHSKSVGRSVLVTKDMPATVKGTVYEIWYDKNGVYVPAGLMDSGGSRTVVLHGVIGNAKGVGITVEPAAGSTTPTSLPIVTFKMSKSV